MYAKSRNQNVQQFVDFVYVTFSGDVEDFPSARSVLAEAQIAPLPSDSDESPLEKDPPGVRCLIMLDCGLSYQILFRLHRTANEVFS